MDVESRTKPTGITMTEVANTAGVSQYMVSTVSRIAGIPRLGPRYGMAPETGRRVASAIRAGLLNEKTARAVAEDPAAVLAALRDLTDLLGEISEAKQSRAA